MRTTEKKIGFQYRAKFNSSFIEESIYNERYGILKLKMNGREYLYAKISIEDYLIFQNSNSQGKIYNQIIKNKKRCLKLI